MKRLILALIVILISTSTLHASKFRWSDGVFTSDRSSKFYLDKGSVKRIGNHIYYWSLGDYLKLEVDDNKDIRSVITYHRVDCDDPDLGYQILIFSAFRDNMAKGEIIFHVADDPDSEKRYDSKDSIAYLTHKRLCN